MKTKSMKIASLLLTMVVLVATFCLFTTMANAAEEQSATITFDNTSKRDASSGSTKQIWRENGITVTHNKGTGNNIDLQYYNPLRLYAKSNFTIEYPGMTKISFDVNASKYVTPLTSCLKTGEVTTSGTTVTVTLDSSVDSYSVSLSAQTRIDSITVYYKASAPAVCEHDYTELVDNKDGATHNEVCTNANCKAIVAEKVPHAGTKNVDNGDGETHNMVCECGAVVTADVPHTEVAIDNQTGTHKIVCDVCKAVIVAEEEHTSSKSCDKCDWVYVKPAPEATITFDDTAKRIEFTTEIQVWTENGVVVTNNKSSSTSNVADYSNPVRFYKSSSVTINYSGITKIVFNCGSETYASDLSKSITEGTVTVESKVVTVVLKAPVDEYTISSMAAQIRVNSITVYAEEPAECEHENKTYVSLNNHNHKVTCADCGAVVEEAHTIVGLGCDKCDFVLPFEFSGWSLTLYDNLSLNFTVNAEFFTNGYSNPSATFAIGERTVVVSEYTEKDGKYVFTLSDIAPYEMTLTIHATLSATKNDETVTSNTEKTIKEYCLQILNDPTKDAKVKTLVVDLLNYGAASQTYADKYTDALANAGLTDAQKELGTQVDPTLDTVANSAYVKVDNAKATWVGAQLLLVDTVEMNFVFRANSTEGLVVKVVTTSNTYTITEFGAYGEGAYVASFSAFNAAQMSEIVDVTVYEGDTAVSNTYRYSIESYACAKQGDKDADLASLVNAMMKYGNSAKAYAEYLKGANA